MRYENTGGYPVDMQDPPLRVWPGDSVESEVHVAGLTPMPDPEEPDPEPAPGVGVEGDTTEPAGDAEPAPVSPVVDEPAATDPGDAPAPTGTVEA